MFNDKKDETIRIADKMFNTLHAVPEVDQFLEKGQEYFRKKYNIDYFSVHMLHHKRSNFIGFYNYDAWHDYLYTHNHGANHKDEFFIKLLPNIKKEELYMEYLDSYVQAREANMRAEIIGVRKHGGCTVIISDKLNNITIYDITFKDDSSFGTLDQKVLYALTKDLMNYKSLLLPFINHVDQMGDFSDKKTLHQSMDTFIREYPSLFHF